MEKHDMEKKQIIRRIAVFVISFILLFAMAACTKDTGDSSSSDPGTVQSGRSEPKSLHNAFMTYNDMKAYLGGDWRMLKFGAIYGETGKDIWLSIEGDLLKITDEDSGRYGSAAYTLGNDFGEDHKAWTTMTLIPYDASDDVKSTSGFADEQVRLQIILATVEDTDILAVRELGNGDAIFTGKLFGGANTANDRFWIFERESKNPQLTQSENDSARLAGKDFYGIVWYDDYGILYIQEITAFPYTDPLFGDEAECITYTYANGARNMYAVQYDVIGDISPDDFPAGHIEYYTPSVAKITVDSSGRVSEIKRFEYMGYGVYLIGTKTPAPTPAPAPAKPSTPSTSTAPSPSSEYNPGTAFPHGAGAPYFPESTASPEGAGTDFRDPKEFYKTDDLFLGTWKIEDSLYDRLYIEEASPQTGGYKVKFHFEGIGDAEGYANILSEHGLYINNIETSDKKFNGYLTEENGRITFTVSYSEWGYLLNGSEIYYVSAYKG